MENSVDPWGLTPQCFSFTDQMLFGLSSADLNEVTLRYETVTGTTCIDNLYDPSLYPQPTSRQVTAGEEGGPQGEQQKPVQCLNANGTVGNDNPGSILKPNVLFGSFDAEGYVMFGIGVHLGGFYDRSTKNYGLFWAFDVGGGLGASAGVSSGVDRDLSSFQGAVSVLGAGIGPVSGTMLLK